MKLLQLPGATTPEQCFDPPQFERIHLPPLPHAASVSIVNGLRRVLLSSLPGAAVTALRIKGGQHEFQDVPGVLEDVTDIVLNIKKLRLRSFSEHPVTMRLEVSGERNVTATDIVAPSTIEIVNPELHIATLDNERARLSMTLTVEQGCGFAVAETKEHQSGDLISVDALYSPVVKVAYGVEDCPQMGADAYENDIGES